MASRAMKRAQGDALTRAAEEAFAGEDASSSESEDDAPARPANAFALLLGSEEDEDEEEEDEQPEPEPEPEPVKAKKSKKKKKASVAQPEDAVDEVAAALRELGEEMPTTTLRAADDLSASGAHAAHAATARNALVAVDRNRMKAEDELKSIFGARAIRAVEAEEGGRGRTSSSRGGWGGGGGARFSRGAHAGHRSLLVTPKDTWPSAPSTRGSGFAMRSLGVDENGYAVFRFAHDDARADARDAFERAKASHDPNALVRLLHHHPWNAQALLALADIHMYTGEGQRSAEMLEMCVYAMEGAWHPAFAEAATRGVARLGESLDASPDDGAGRTLADVEPSPSPNRVFLDAMFKHTQALTRRGCHRAALECAKLSLSLDRSDPTGLLCAVDYFALRCGETDWLLDFAGEFREDGSLLALPGFAFSAALARMGGEAGARLRGGRRREEEERGKKPAAGKSRRRRFRRKRFGEAGDDRRAAPRAADAPRGADGVASAHRLERRERRRALGRGADASALRRRARRGW